MFKTRYKQARETLSSELFEVGNKIPTIQGQPNLGHPEKTKSKRKFREKRGKARECRRLHFLCCLYRTESFGNFFRVSNSCSAFKLQRKQTKRKNGKRKQVALVNSQLRNTKQRTMKIGRQVVALLSITRSSSLHHAVILASQFRVASPASDRVSRSKLSLVFFFSLQRTFTVNHVCSSLGVMCSMMTAINACQRTKLSDSLELT